MLGTRHWWEVLPCVLSYSLQTSQIGNLHCRDATLPSLKYQLSMTFMIKATIFATGHTALMICALTLSLTALLSAHPAEQPVITSNALAVSLAFPALFLPLKPLFLFHTEPNFCCPMNPFFIPPPTHIGMKLDLPVRTSIPGNSIICVSTYLIHVSSLDYELHESKNSN